jgi:uncharacterized protein
MSATFTKMPVWHEGELFIQEKLGVAERMASVGQRIVRDYMPDQHREFYAQLPFMVLGSVDGSGRPWATLLEGAPGFVVSPTPTTLDIAARLDPTDPAATGIGANMPVGLLGIELHTRRRNRMNGVVSLSAAGLHIDVDQSFGNCPRYIQLRDFEQDREPGQLYSGAVEVMERFDEGACALIECADTFYVATYADREDRRQVDVSHRGGKTGFVRIGSDGALTIPDFDGNQFFSTLGNIVLNGRAGLLFVDHACGDMLQMTGEANIIFDSPEIAAFQGAERLWTFKPSRIVRRKGALSLRWQFRTDDGWSPASLMTGDWVQAADRLRAAELANIWRPFKVTKIVDESRTIRSFHLHPDDGAGLLPHMAGQHLPIRLTLPGTDKPVIRTYTLSVAPSDGYYRISVKRDGAVSRHLHTLNVGDIIEARPPGGQFTIDAHETRPAVLLAGGVGITPLLAMLRHIVYEGARTRHTRPTFILHAVRSKAERPFSGELAALVEESSNTAKLIRILSNTDDAVEGIDYDFAGRIDMALLTRVLPFNDYDFYLCGPPAFTQALCDGLRNLNVADDHIHSETFGPSSLMRMRDTTSAPPATTTPSATKPVAVSFSASHSEARWTPGSGTLLELAEAAGLEPEFSCREGTCGTCKVKVLSGVVTHIRRQGVALAEDEALICSAVPGDQANEDEARLELAL